LQNPISIGGQARYKKSNEGRIVGGKWRGLGEFNCPADWDDFVHAKNKSPPQLEDVAGASIGIPFLQLKMTNIHRSQRFQN